MYHHAVSNVSTASAIIAPQLGFGSSMPTPRNDSDASSRTFAGITSVA